MPSTLADFNLSTRKLRYEFGIDINNDSVAEQTYEDSVDYINIYETIGQIAGVKSLIVDTSLFLTTPSTQWSRSGVKTYTSVKTTNDNWATEYKESLFVGSTVRNNSVPVNDVKIKATTYNDDFLDKKVARQLFTNTDIATIMTSLLVSAGVALINISLPATGFVLPVYLVSDNFTIRYYIEDLAKGALQVVGFNRKGIFSSNSILKNDFNGSFPAADVTITLDDIISFKNREIQSNMYYNDITVRSYDYSLITDTQFYFNSELSGYSVEAGKRLVFEVEIDGVNPFSINPLVSRNSNFNLLVTFGYRNNSFFEFFDAEDNGNTNNTGIVILSTSVVPGSREGQDKILIVFNNTSGSTKYLKQILLNGTVVSQRSPYETSIVDNVAIINDGKRIPLVFESNAIQGDVRANEIALLIALNLSTYANVYSYEIQGRPQLEIGSVISFRDRSNAEIIGVVYEIDTEISQDAGYSQFITVRALANLNNYLALDDATRGLDDANLQLL